MTATVFLVDDDDAVLRALTEILSGEGLPVRGFASAEAFLEACCPESSGCVVLDVSLPGLDGPSAFRTLRQRGVELPVIFLTGHGDVPMSVRAMKAGAFDFLEKPIASEALIARVRAALDSDERRHEQRARQTNARERFAQLTSREREVLDRILAGKTAKVIGRELGISPRTIEVHRKHILLKTGTTNVLELDAMARLALGEGSSGAGAADPG